MKQELYLGAWANVMDNEGNIWFSNSNFNGLFVYRSNGNKIQYIGQFDYAGFDVELLHTHARFYEDKVFFFPSAASEYISIYDKEKNELTYTKLPERICTTMVGDTGSHLVCYCSVNKNVFEVSLRANEVVRNDFATSWFHSVYNKEDDLIRFNGGRIYVIHKNNYVDEFVLETGTHNSLYVDCKYGEVGNIFFLSGIYWISFIETGDIVSISLDADIINIYKAENDRWLYVPHNTPYSKVYECDGEIWLLGYYRNGIFKIDRKNRKIVSLFDFPNDYFVSNAVEYGAVYYSVICHNGTYYFMPQRGSKLFILNTNMLEDVDFCITAEDYMEFKHSIYNKGITKEDEIKYRNNLKEFLSFLI